MKKIVLEAKIKCKICVMMSKYCIGSSVDYIQAYRLTFLHIILYL